MVENPSAPKTILLCDDNEVERNTLRRLLRRHGFATTEAENATQGIDKLRAIRPAVVLLDMLMPEGDGWYFLSLLREYPDLSDTPVVIVTGMEVASPEWAESLGAKGLVRKPVVPEHLLNAIYQACP